MEEKQVLVRIEDLCKYFRLSSKEELKAVDHVSFDIFRNETVGIVGESGCGKTTLGRTVLGLYPATSGRVLFDGMDVHSAGKREMREFKKRAQIMLQDPYASLNPRMTVRDIIAEGLETRGNFSKAEKDERVCELLSLVGLRPEYRSRYPHEFFPAASVRGSELPGLWLWSRSSSSVTSRSLPWTCPSRPDRNLFGELKEKLGLTYLFIAHDLSMVRHISDRVGVMYLGMMAEMADSRELYENPRHPYTKALLSAIPSTDPDQP